MEAAIKSDFATTLKKTAYSKITAAERNRGTAIAVSISRRRGWRRTEDTDRKPWTALL